MARPIKTDRPVEKNLSLPSSLVARVDLELFSALEGKVPFGAWQKYVVRLIEEDLAKLQVVQVPAEGWGNVRGKL